MATIILEQMMNEPSPGDIIEMVEYGDEYDYASDVCMNTAKKMHKECGLLVIATLPPRKIRIPGDDPFVISRWKVYPKGDES